MSKAHPHFAGRTTVYDMGCYTTSATHVAEWMRVLSCFSGYLNLEPGTLLSDMAEPLLLASNGTIGLLEKWLWTCKQVTECRGLPITEEVIRRHAPPIFEQQRISDDIRRGVDSLRNFAPTAELRAPGAGGRGQPREVPDSSTRPKERRRAFESSPRRIQIKGIEIYQGD